MLLIITTTTQMYDNKGLQTGTKHTTEVRIVGEGGYTFERLLTEDEKQLFVADPYILWRQPEAIRRR